MVERNKETEESPLDQRIRINEMKMTLSANESNTAETASRVMNDKREEEISMENSDNSTEGKSRVETAGENNQNDAYAEEILKIMEGIFSELGCRPKKENDNELTLTYQGENFIVRTGGYYAQIWDPGWAHINVNDPNFENMKTAANISNFDFGPSVIWTSPNEDGIVTLHSKREILFHPNLPDKNGYIQSVLDSFFEKKENMRGRLHALVTQQQQPPKHHRPVGFATSEEEN